MGITCERCGRDIDALGQDNMGEGAPLCEDCWSENQSHAVAVLERENANLLRRNKGLSRSVDALGRELTEARRRLRERSRSTWPTCEQMRNAINGTYVVSRERALALTKLDECEMWLGRCEPRETAAPTLKGAAAAADAQPLQPLMREAVE